MNPINIKTQVLLKCNDNKRKAVRLVVYEDKAEFFVRLDLCGAGLNFEWSEFNEGGFRHEHLAYGRLEEEITCLEQINFEVTSRDDTSSLTFDLNAVKSKPIQPLSYAKLNSKQIDGLIGHPCLEVYSGIQVVMVFDEFYDIAVYPANKIGVPGAALPLPKSYVNMIKSAFKRLHLGYTILEGFYSAMFGFVVVDAAYLNGENIFDITYTQRYEKMKKVVGHVKSSIFKAADMKISSKADLGCSAYSVVHSPILFLKKENSSPLSCVTKSDCKIDTLIIDDAIPERASLRLDGNYIECLNVTSGQVKKRPSVFSAGFKYNFFEYANVACNREQVCGREPLIFF
ncbi:hypothetical protein [Pseudoalteromonas sp. SK20]|uniref:hypothetical protein n=1 Tax=Pseudoalteromonas sp. SK20 TaxID=1938367 RepID=UPI0009782F68|nr:hypothetical protein [Pseudoalteromonas sp. SK20]